VQIDRVADEALAGRIEHGRKVEDDWLAARRVRVLRRGGRNSWLEIVLDEGRNRHIRRLLAALDVSVLRLVRVAIGPLPLGNLAKGTFRFLSDDEVKSLAVPTRPWSG